LFRPLSLLPKLLCAFVAVACASPEELTTPPASGNGGNTSASQGGSDATGGTSAIQSSVSETGGVGLQTGGNGNAQGGSIATGGAPLVTGGAAAAGGGSTAAVKLEMTWKKGSSDQASEVSITLPTGAEPILASRVSLELCGQGNAAMIKATDMTFDQASLICTTAATPADCNYGSNKSLKDAPTAMTISVSGIPRDCCYKLDLAKVNHSLAVGGKIFLVYRFQTDANVVGMNYTNGAVWRAFVDDELSATCTLAPWPSTTTTCS